METAAMCPRHRDDVELHLLPDGSALLYDPTKSQGFALTALAALVWEMCDGEMSGEQIVAELSRDLAEVPGVEERARAFLAEFGQLGLLGSASR